MKKETIKRKLERIDDLPTLPVIAMEVNNMLTDYDTSINMLCDRLSRDQAMVSRILKLVNSAFFGFRSKINNIHHAVVILGFNTIRNAIISISIIKALQIDKELHGLDIKEFWKHSVSVAVISRYLAEQSKMIQSDDCFVGGLLHDMGKIILYQNFKDLFMKVWISVTEKNLSFYEAEKSQIAIDHAFIGGYLARKWKLPQDLVDAIRYHHSDPPDTIEYCPRNIVQLADKISNTFREFSEFKTRLSSIFPWAKRMITPQLDIISNWYPEIELEIESACKFFLEEPAK